MFSDILINSMLKHRRLSLINSMLQHGRLSLINSMLQHGRLSLSNSMLQHGDIGRGVIPSFPSPTPRHRRGVGDGKQAKLMRHLGPSRVIDYWNGV